MKKLLLIAVAVMSACGEPEEFSTESSQCVYKPVGYCERLDDDSFIWTEWKSEAILSDYDRSLLRNVSVMTCEECIGQEGVYRCELNNYEIPCEGVR